MDWEERMAERARAKRQDHETVQDQTWEDAVAEAAPEVERILAEMERPTPEEAQALFDCPIGCACVGPVGPLRGLVGAPCNCQVKILLAKEVLGQ